jgi:O-antigen/teichoic acid export membrane protein
MIGSIKSKIKGWLLWLQRVLAVDMLYIAHGGFWTTFNFVASSLLSLAMVWAYGNLLSKETYGIYKYILSLSGLLTFFTFTGMNTAVTQSTARSDNSNILPFSVKFQLKWNLLFSTASFILGLYYGLRGNYLFMAAMFVLGISVPINQAYNTYGAFLSGKKEFKLLNIFGVLASAFQIAALVITYILTKNILIFIIVYALSDLIPNLLFYELTCRWFGSIEPVSNDDKKGLIKYGAHLSFMHVLSNIAQYGDKIVIFHYLGAVQLAVYSLAIAIPERIRGYLKSVSGIMLPKLSSKDPHEIKRVFYKRIFQGMLIGAVISIAYILAAPYVFKYLLPKYMDALNYSRVYSLYLILIIPAGYTSGVFNGKKMVSSLYYGSTIVSIARIGLYIILGKLYGIWGIILTILLVNVLGTFLNFLLWEINYHNLE